MAQCPKIIEERVLGSAYSLIFWVQNIGLCLVPLLIGSVLDSSNAANPAVVAAKAEIEQLKAQGVQAPDVFIPYNYTVPLVIFACFGVAALLLALYLKALDKKSTTAWNCPTSRNNDNPHPRSAGK